MNATRAENIIQHRIKNGTFKSREALRDVKNIGKKTYTQCAGFIRIEPLTAGANKINVLDATWVHPESYGLANKIVKKLRLTIEDVGSTTFARAVKAQVETNIASELAKAFLVPKERVWLQLQ